MQELAWRLEEAASRVEEWAFWTSLSVGESVENLLDQVSKIPQALSDYLQDVGFRLEGLAISAESALENLSTKLQEWWGEQRAHLEEALEKVGTRIKEVGDWLSENAEKVALGVGVAGVSLGVAGLGVERIGEDVQRFYRDAVVAVQVDLKERFAAFLEEVRGLDDLAKQIVGDIAQGKLSFSSQGEASYGERADPIAGPEHW